MLNSFASILFTSKFYHIVIFLANKFCNSNKVLFDNLEKATNALNILYGNDNYESYNITVELKDDGYIIKLAEHFLAG